MRDDADERPYMEAVRRATAIDVRFVTPPADVSPWQVTESSFESRGYPTLNPRHYLNEALTAAAAAGGAGLVIGGGGGELGPTFRAPAHDSRWSPGAAVRAARAAIRRFGRRIGGHHASDDRGILPNLNAMLREDAIRSANLFDAVTAPRPAWDHADGSVRIGYPADWRKPAHSGLAGVAWGIDQTHPLRDPRVWQYCAGLPCGLARRRGYNRFLIRAAMEGILPEAIRWRTTKGPFSPDYYARMGQGLDWARAVSRDVEPGSLAAQWIDLKRLNGTLASLAAADLCHRNINLVFRLQGTVIALQYLRWFEQSWRDS